MEVILKEDIIGLGYKNDIVNVKSGYGRNYLIPTQKAVIASQSARKQLAEDLKQQAHKLAALKAEAETFLPLVPQMIRIGEQSGGIDKMMDKAATYYELELDNKIKAISTTIEPILMVLLAIVVGGIVLSILLPVYNLASENITP